MTTSSQSLEPLSDADVVRTRKGLAEYWTQVEHCDDLTELPEDLVRDAKIRVTELLATGQNCDVYEASRVTAEFEYKRTSR